MDLDMHCVGTESSFGCDFFFCFPCMYIQCAWPCKCECRLGMCVDVKWRECNWADLRSPLQLSFLFICASFSVFRWPLTAAEEDKEKDGNDTTMAH